MTVASPRPRPARRAPTDLPFRFADEGLAEALAAERSEPDWLRAERIAAFEAFERAPDRAEPAVHDLPRPAQRRAVRAPGRTSGRPAPPNAIASTELPEGVAGLIDLREDGVAGLVLEPAAVAAGVILETFGAALARDPDGLRAELEGGAGLPDDDKLAAAGPRLLEPGRPARTSRPASASSDRSSSAGPVGAADRALIARTLISLGDGAEASLLEELGPSGTDPGRRRPVAARRHARGDARARRQPGRRQPPGAAADARSRSSIATRSSARAPRSTGRSPSSARGWSAAASTTGSRATAARSSRSRSCSAARTSCST